MERPREVYRLSVWGVPTEVPGLWTVRVVVENMEDQAEPEMLFEINVSWQEDSGHE